MGKTRARFISPANCSLDSISHSTRWEIETLFSCLKGRGFNFEETRLTDQDKVEKLMAVLAMAAAWFIKWVNGKLKKNQFDSRNSGMGNGGPITVIFDMGWIF